MARIKYTESYEVDTTLPSSSDDTQTIYGLILLLHPYYTGRWRVWRITHIDHLSLVFGAFIQGGMSKILGYDSYQLSSSYGTFEHPKVYCIEDLQTGGVRWYVEGYWRRYSVNEELNSKPSIYMCGKVCMYSDILYNQKLNDVVWSHNVFVLDYVLDTYVYKVANDEEFEGLLRKPVRTVRKLTIHFPDYKGVIDPQGVIP